MTSDARDQDEMTTLEAELRQALQRQAAEYERLAEVHVQVEDAMLRARAALARLRRLRREAAAGG